MRLSEYLREDLVLHGMGVKDLPEALRAFGAAFEAGGHLRSGRVVRALEAREASHTTCLGHGVAVPHATLEGLPKPVLLVATSFEPVPFGPPDTDPVDVFFVLLSPPGREGEHIKLLARLCRLARHPEDLDEIRAAQNRASLLKTMLELDSRHV
jgi:PTS system nitrogen regulatory IIA component